MTGHNPVRIDKYLWATRIFKTRTMASDACRMGRVLVNDSPAKPSRMIEGKEVLTVRKPPAMLKYRVLVPLENRVSARLVSDYIEDITPESERIKVEISRSIPTGFRKKGTGRPTKKERRTIDRWKDDISDS